MGLVAQESSFSPSAPGGCDAGILTLLQVLPSVLYSLETCHLDGYMTRER